MDTHSQPPERDRSALPERGGRRWSRSVRWAAASALAVLLLGTLVNAFVLQPFSIPSGSMENTLRVGDRVLVNKLAYRFGNHPARGDVVVFDGTGSFVPEGTGASPASGVLRTVGAAVGLASSPKRDYVKRVIGVGGDRVVCCDEQGRIEVNGEPLHEGYLYPGDTPSTVPFDVVVPPGRLWVMGDHRSDSQDSRAHLGSPGGGMVPEERVIGRVDWIGWPVDRWGAVRHDAAHRAAAPRVPAAEASVGAHG